MQINILQNDEDAFLKHHPETIKKPAVSAAGDTIYIANKSLFLKNFKNPENTLFGHTCYSTHGSEIGSKVLRSQTR